MAQVTQSITNNIGILEIDYPPVNALSQQVRQGILDGLSAFADSEQVKAIIIRCAQRTFIAGADIKEFGQPPSEPFLPDVVNAIEASEKPVIASMFGTSLGGGFEVALACHYRVALSNAKVGLPEVNLGLIPGAGGTQRLPRIVGVNKSIEMITTGKHYVADAFSETDLFDRVFDATHDLNEQTLAFVEALINDDKLVVKRTGQLTVKTEDTDWEQLLSDVMRKARGRDAPMVAANVIQQTINLPVVQGMAIERAAFLSLRESEQSAALRYAFSAEKQAGKTSLSAEPAEVKSVGIIGAGNMGSGIATAFLAAGYQCHLIEQSEAGLQAGEERVKSNFTRNVASKRMTEAQANDCVARLYPSTELASVADCDLIVEAIFEDIAVKQTLFQQLDKICQSEAIFATNTSYLDINEIATVVNEPARVIGMHFFSPANIMKLLEIVQAKHSSETALATAMQVGKKLGKMSVLVGVCFGFAGNRMYTRYGREVQQMLLEGASIEQVDNAMKSFGMAMGPLLVQDLSGIDIGHRARSAQPFPEYDPGYFRAAAVMVENNRLGRKTNAGFYQYQDGKAIVDPEAERLIADKAASLGIKRGEFTDEAIIERALYALISEGLALYKEGIVSRLSDIDVIWLHGYGFPRHKGGPMFQASRQGKDKVAKQLATMRDKFGAEVWPEVDLSPLD